MICDNCGLICNPDTMEIVYLPAFENEVTMEHGMPVPVYLNPEAWCPECQVSQADTYDVRVGA